LQRLEAIGQITSGVAHDFNNLLSVVLMNARLLLHKPHDEVDNEALELISAAAQRGAKLTAQLLAFARKQRLEPRPVDLNSVISGLDDLLSVTLGGTVQLNKTFAPDLRVAMVDPNQIELTVLNLALNARDAMQPGGTLTFETFNAIVEREPSRLEEPAPGEYVVLAVKDTGTGIPDDVFPRVFEPFFTTKEPGKGSGLGLSQVVGFAKQSGGGVSIDTRAGEGTSVKVFLPRATGVLEEGEGEAGFAGERKAAVSHQSPQATTLRVLVVDDDKEVLNSTLRTLDFLGYAAVSAGSGDEALRLVGGKLDIDIVLADFAMPKMSGVELAKTLHLLRPALPVILITGYGDSEILKRLDGSQILQKPYSAGDLVEKIKAALS
jgi:CheY-like chemotaxis protein